MSENRKNRRDAMAELIKRRVNQVKRELHELKEGLMNKAMMNSKS